MCSKKMVVALPIWLEFSKGIAPELKSLLTALSASTIDRLLKPYKKKRGLSSTRPSLIKTRIPLKLLDGEVTKPGYVEGDRVAHCGDTLLGQFANSLTVTDLFSAWTENRALWTKSADQVVQQIKRVEENLPFPLLGFASDNGSEFLNELLAGHFHNRLRAVEFVRRRPYKKNDNAHVEQKNNTHVRELFGYQRFEHPELVVMMNEIYQAFWNPLQNYFTPTLKLKEKIRVGGKIKKKYDAPKTPCQRLLESPDLPIHLKRKLKQELACKNPFVLKQELDKRLKLFFEAVDRLKKQQHVL